MTRTLWPRLPTALAALLLATLPAAAIDGGRLAGRNRLSQATVGIGTVTAGDETVGFSRCSGVLIGPRLVLTAAHCVRGDPLASAVVLYDGAQPLRPAIRVTSIARYDALGEDDVPAEYATLASLSLDTAVLRLAEPVRGRAPLAIRHGRLPPSGLRLAGAGLSAEGVGVLKTTPLQPLAMTRAGLIIAETRGAAVCRGDSGGPVVADGPGGPVLWGVASAVLSSNGSCGPHRRDRPRGAAFLAGSAAVRRRALSRIKKGLSRAPGLSSRADTARWPYAPREAGAGGGNTARV